MFAFCIPVYWDVGASIWEQLNEIVRILDRHLQDHFDRAAQRMEKRKDEDFDEGVEEILEDEVSKLIWNVKAIIRVMLLREWNILKWFIL